MSDIVVEFKEENPVQIVFDNVVSGGTHVQADWDQKDNLDGAYILNKPTFAKKPCQVATKTNLVSLSGLLVVDGYTCQDGDRVLVKDQTDQTENGIYVASSGAWTRDTDFDGSVDAKIFGGEYTFIVEGSKSKGGGFVVINALSNFTGTNGACLFGTDIIEFSQFGAVIKEDSATGGNVANVVNISQNGFGVRIDNDSIIKNASDQLEVDHVDAGTF